MKRNQPPICLLATSCPIPSDALITYWVQMRKRLMPVYQTSPRVSRVARTGRHRSHRSFAIQRRHRRECIDRMSGQLGDPVVGERLSMSPARDAANDYRRLVGTLASRARWLGSRDPEGAAQEALRRSLENSHSQPAVHFYFSENLPAGLDPPEWPLDQLFAWLHGVLYYVVREERDRVSSQ